VILSQPLSIEMVARRKRRNVAVLLAGAVVLILAAVALPDAPPDVNSELQRIAEREEDVWDRYEASVREAERGAMSEADLAATVERDILPDLVEIRRRIEGIIDTPHVRHAQLLRLTEYMKMREESLKLRVEAIREQDMGKLERAEKLWANAEEIAKELSDQ
jgi:hypothetical protein